MNFSIQEIINNQLRQERDAREKKKQTTWYASGLGTCLTGVYLTRAGIAEKEYDDRALRVFKVGNIFEDWIVDTIVKAGKKVELQERIEIPEFNVSGKIDIIVDGLIYEIKTINSKGFTYLDKGGAKLQHKMQLWLYLYAQQKKEGRLIYFDKDNLRVMEFVQFLKDEKTEKEVRRELGILNKAWEAQLPPRPIEDKKDWRVKYCATHQLCTSQPKYLESLI